MSFEGLASALVVLIVVGGILGILLKAEIDGTRPFEIPSSEVPTATPGSFPLTDNRVKGSAAIDLSLSEDALEQWESDLKQREAELNAERKRLEDLEEDLEERSARLDRERADFEAWRKEIDARVKAELESLEARQDDVNQLWGWAVLALCAAGAVTVGNGLGIAIRWWT